MKFLTSLDNYNILYEVAKCGNITKASENLYISQPAVSQAIKKLEENLDVTLVIRSKKGVELTPIAKKILEKVEVALQNLSAIEQIVDEEKGLLKGELIIGAGSNIARKVLCKPIAEFVLDYPLVNFKIIENVQTKMIEMLRVGELNFVLTQYNEEINFPFMPIFNTPYCFVKSVDCEIDKFIMISDGSYANTLFSKFINEKNLVDTAIMQVSGYKTALELVNLGVGTTLLPRYMIQEDLDNNKLIEVFTDYKLPDIQFGVYYNPDLLMPVGKAFFEYLKD